MALIVWEHCASPTTDSRITRRVSRHPAAARDRDNPCCL